MNVVSECFSFQFGARSGVRYVVRMNCAKFSASVACDLGIDRYLDNLRSVDAHVFGFVPRMVVMIP